MIVLPTLNCSFFSPKGASGQSSERARSGGLDVHLQIQVNHPWWTQFDNDVKTRWLMVYN